MTLWDHTPPGPPNFSVLVRMITVDMTNAAIEFIAVVAAGMDIRRLLIDKATAGFNIWMLFYWLVYGAWETFVAWTVHLPISAVVIAIWMIVYSVKTYLTFYYRYAKR